jgi:hypothetical protein
LNVGGPAALRIGMSVIVPGSMREKISALKYHKSMTYDVNQNITQVLRYSACPEVSMVRDETYSDETPKFDAWVRQIE